MRRIFISLFFAITCAVLPSAGDATDAQRSFWSDIKAGLTGPDGPEYWEVMQDALIPGGYSGVNTLPATVISGSLDVLVVAISDRQTPEVTLRLRKPLEALIPAGSDIEFEGVAITFTAEPFMVTLEVPRSRPIIRK